MASESIPAGRPSADAMYQEVATDYGPALQRLARAYEADPDRRLDLLQEIHFHLWRSLADFAGRCSLRTWVYRVAHNVAASHIAKSRRSSRMQAGLEDLEALPAAPDSEAALAGRSAHDRLLRLIERLKPLDRQVILSYLEGLDAASIAEITGLSSGNVATKIHRIKGILARQFHEGEHHAQRRPQ